VAARHALAVAYATANRPRDAEKEYRAILKVEPTFAPANFGLGLLALRDGRADEGAQSLMLVLRASPEDVRATTLLAEYYETKGDRPQAITQLERLAALNPRLPSVRAKLITLYAETGRIDDAIARARDALADDPRSAMSHQVLGRLFLQKGDLKRATESFNQALALDANDGPSLLGLGNVYRHAGEIARAEAMYRKALALDPRNAAPYNNLAWLYVSAGRDLNEALRLAEQAQALAPDAPAVLDTLGFVHYKRGEYASAAPLLVKAAASMSANASVQYHLGMTMYRLGRHDEARRALRRSLELDGKLADAAEVRTVLHDLEARAR
jgi:tetratricopeptide (TPR) repeat protein